MKLFKFDILDSTNNYIKILIENDKEEPPFAALALQQSAGKGRYNRNWISEFGNLYLSIAVKNNLDPEYLGHYSLLTSLVVYYCLEEIGLSEIELKWPNDVLIHGKKVCGILLEYIPEKSIIIIGIGININNYPKDDVIFPATCLENFNITITQEKLTGMITDKLSFLINDFSSEKCADIRSQWLSKAYKFGKNIDVNLSDKKLSGRFIDINKNAELIIEYNAADGKLINQNINFADIY